MGSGTHAEQEPGPVRKPLRGRRLEPEHDVVLGRPRQRQPGVGAHRRSPPVAADDEISPLHPARCDLAGAHEAGADDAPPVVPPQVGQPHLRAEGEARVAGGPVEQPVQQRRLRHHPHRPRAELRNGLRDDKRLLAVDPDVPATDRAARHLAEHPVQAYLVQGVDAERQHALPAEHPARAWPHARPVEPRRRSAPAAAP